jgi:hypothetical protein
MLVNIEEFLPVGVLECYEAGAAARGLPLADFVRDFLIKNAPVEVESVELSGGAWERAFDELFDSFPRVGPLPDEAFSRETMYGREDKW